MVDAVSPKAKASVAERAPHKEEELCLRHTAKSNTSSRPQTHFCSRTLFSALSCRSSSGSDVLRASGNTRAHRVSGLLVQVSCVPCVWVSGLELRRGSRLWSVAQTRFNDSTHRQEQAHIRTTFKSLPEFSLLDLHLDSGSPPLVPSSPSPLFFDA
eukprot:97277-Rhodomonas_salina.2